MAAQRQMTVTEARALPVSVDIVTAGRAFGMSRDASYRAVAGGKFPVRVIRAGRCLVVPRAEILRVLCIDDIPHARGA